MSAWRKFPDELPPEKRCVLVLLEGYSEAVDLGVELKRGGGLVAHTPRAVVMAYMKQNSVGPYFVTVGVGGPKRAVTHWCDCLPEEAQKPWDWLPKEEAQR